MQQQKNNILHADRYHKTFEVVKLLGKGGFGTVMKVMDRLEQKYYAVKKVRLHLPHSDDLIKAI